MKVSFKNKKQLIKALIKGRVFLTSTGNKIYFDEKASDPFRYNDVFMNGIAIPI